MWSGLADPGDTRDELMSVADSDAQLLGRLVEAWEEVDPLRRGRTIGLVLQELQEDDDKRRRTFTRTEPPRYPLFRQLLPELAPADHGKLPSAKALGKRFQRFRRRSVGGKCLDHSGDTRAGALWVVRVGQLGGACANDANRTNGFPPKKNEIEINLQEDHRGDGTGAIGAIGASAREAGWVE